MVTPDLDAIAARAEAATPGPWERGDVWRRAGVLPEMFGQGRCALCNSCGEPVWVGQDDINGERMRAHKHRAPEPYRPDHLISGQDGLVVGNYDHEEGGVLDPADTEFIAHARTDVDELVAEVRRLRAAVADAWDEGWRAGQADEFDAREGREHEDTPNPYRDRDGDSADGASSDLRRSEE